MLLLGRPGVLGSVAVAGVLAAAAYSGTDVFLAQHAGQQVADRWAGLARCLIGGGLDPGERPSQRLRAVQLAEAGQATAPIPRWPERCAAYARDLDRALDAGTMRRLPGLAAPGLAARILKLGADPRRYAATLDSLWTILERADLPEPRLSREASAGLAPAAPARTALRADDLAPMARDVLTQDVVVEPQPAAGQELRLLFPGHDPSWCRFEDGASEIRWSRATCRALPQAMGAGRASALRFARGERGAPDLFYLALPSGADGLFDASSGQRLWRPRSAEAQAVVDAQGRIAILHAEHREPRGAGPIQEHRLAELRPGEPPASRRLRIPVGAQALLLPDLVLWWQRDGAADHLYAEPLDTAVASQAAPLGPLPPGARYVDDCGSSEGRAVLFAAAEARVRYALAFHRAGRVLAPVAVAAIEGPVALGCHHGRASVLALRRRPGPQIELARWTCSPDGCAAGTSQPLRGALAQGPLVAAAPLGHQVLVAGWSEAAGLRLRLAALEEIHERGDIVLLDTAEPGSLVPQALRLVARESVALLLLGDRQRQLFAIRLDGSGAASGVRR
ncbi:MAG: hypothetical protein HY744_17790 [Deltaproteobacteria bacterium]|nr:hypothetical protein [Deltaproteobacteria bacterium]